MVWQPASIARRAVRARLATSRRVRGRGPGRVAERVRTRVARWRRATALVSETRLPFGDAFQNRPRELMPWKCSATISHHSTESDEEIKQK